MSRTPIADIVKFSESLRLLCEKHNAVGFGFRVYQSFKEPFDLEEVKTLPKSLIRSGYFYVKFVPGVNYWHIGIGEIKELIHILEETFLEKFIEHTFKD